MDGLKGHDASRVCRLEAPWTEAVHLPGNMTSGYSGRVSTSR
jgi:hypothetical protein